VHDLRSALDHAITDLTIAENGKPLERTEFPIFHDEASYSLLRSQGTLKGRPAPTSGLYKIRGVGDRAKEVIHKLQPFEFQKSLPIGQVPMLSLLHHLNIVDKHRTIHILRYRAAKTSWRALRDVQPVEPLGLGLPVGEIKDGTKVAEWFPVAEPKEEMDIEFTLEFDIALGEAEPPLDSFKGQRVVDVCNTCASGVRTIIDSLSASGK
jgi:hypothetical protein